MVISEFWYCCRSCGHEYQWSGKYTDMPPCPKCGDRPDRSELEHYQRLSEILAACRYSRSAGVFK